MLEDGRDEVVSGKRKGGRERWLGEERKEKCSWWKNERKDRELRRGRERRGGW